jgi:hypothetical protein
MRSVYGERHQPAAEIDGHSCRVTTNLSRRPKFAKCAEGLWRKPIPTIAAIANCDVRTAQRMLAGQAEIPWCVLRAAIDEMLKPAD